MKKLLLPLVPMLWSAMASSASAESALTALRALPPSELDRLAVIAGCEGSPEPEQWHFLVYDPEAEHGVREYVVANQRVIARREISQFAQSLSPKDVIGQPIRLDSNQLAYVVNEYARVNQKAVETINYDLRKDGPGTTPVWRVECMDAQQKTVGAISIVATQSPILAYSGFKAAPPLRYSTPTPSPSRLPPVAEQPIARQNRGGFRSGDAFAQGERRGFDAREDDEIRDERRSRPASRAEIVRRAEPVYPGEIPRRTDVPLRRILRSLNPFDD